MDPNLWFDISRIVLIVAGLFTAIGGYGVLHFGNINSQNQNEKIAESNRIAALANGEAAEANKVSAIANRDAENAKLKATNAEAKSIENENRSKTLEIELEKEKQKTIKAEQELNKLKKETENIKIETDRIRTLEIYLIATFQGEFVKPPGNSEFLNVNSIGAGLSLDIDEQAIVKFKPNSLIKSNQLGENAIQYQVRYQPIDLLKLNTLPIERLTEVHKVSIRVQQQLTKTTYLTDFVPTAKSRYDIVVIINGIETLNFNAIEKGLGDFLSQEKQQIEVKQIFEDSYIQYKAKTGRDDN